jgi:hypothetical protein
MFAAALDLGEHFRRDPARIAGFGFRRFRRLLQMYDRHGEIPLEVFSLTIKRMAIGRGQSNIGTLRHRLRSSQPAPSRWLARARWRDRFRNESHPSARPFCAAVAANHSKASRGGRTSIDVSRHWISVEGGTPLNTIDR